MPASRHRAGKQGRISWEGTALNLKEWTSDHKGDDLDTTNFEDNGLETGKIGIEVVDFTIKGDWDAGFNYYGDPPGIFPKDDAGPIMLYLSSPSYDNKFWSLPLARVLSARSSVPVRGLVSFEATCKSQGPFTKPT